MSKRVLGIILGVMGVVIYLPVVRATTSDFGGLWINLLASVILMEVASKLLIGKWGAFVGAIIGFALVAFSALVVFIVFLIIVSLLSLAL